MAADDGSSAKLTEIRMPLNQQVFVRKFRSEDYRTMRKII